MFFLGIKETSIPANSLLSEYAFVEETHADCFVTELDRKIALEEYVRTFFSTPVFRLERLLLKLAGNGCTNKDVMALADGTGTQMAVWKVMKRLDNELLLEVKNSPIKTWLRVDNSGDTARLSFGSVVLPQKDKRTGQPKIGKLFRALMGFHLLYSKILLWSARLKLTQV